MGVNLGLLLGRHDKHCIECHNNRHLLGRLLGTMIHPKDLYFLHHVDRLPVIGLRIEHHCSSNNVVLNNNNNLDLFCRTDRGHKTLEQQILPRGLGAPTLRTYVGLVESHATIEIFLLRRKEISYQQEK
jgi:hypothetical protein